MKKLVLIGVSHVTPFGVEWLTTELEKLNLEYGAPKFVAVEYKKEYLDQLISQKNPFESLIDSHLAHLSEEIRKALKDSYYYDGLTHLKVWDTQTIWLDQDLNLENYSFSKAMELRFDQLNQDCVQQGDLCALHNNFNAAAKPNLSPADKEREKKWMFILEHELKNLKSDEYGVVIVGGNHLKGLSSLEDSNTKIEIIALHERLCHS